MILSSPAPANETVGSTVRSLIASLLRVNPRRVTDQARLTKDLRADRLDRLELMIAIEDELAGLSIADDEADQMILVGDVIRFVEAHLTSAERAGRPQEDCSRYEGSFQDSTAHSTIAGNGLIGEERTWSRI